MLKTGDKAPDFSLQNQDGKTKTLGDYAGKWLALYIYPKDDTPGCTIQGKSFTATKAFSMRSHCSGASEHRGPERRRREIA